MQTLLNNQRSDIGSPYVYYTLTVNPSNRTATQVDLEFTLEATLRSGSSMYSGQLTGYFEFPNDQTRNFNVYDGGSWVGENSKSVTADWTINADASATSIPTKFKVVRTGGSAGTLYEMDFDVEIPIGHEVPSNITYTMTEINPLLISAGVSNNLIVENLSIKQFDINYTLHGGATLVSLGMYNRIYPYSSTSSPVTIDLRQNTLVKAINDNTKIPLRAFVKDSFTTQGISSETLYDYITFTPISLTETSTIAKRDGQISGKVNLNINGTYFNGTIGNVSQATYKPVIKYKFWRTDASEPNTYDYTIPSSNVTISNGTFSVSDYNIGSTDESAINYFNPDYAYRIKIRVEDNFSLYYSIEKSIPVGDATWTEYPDHVDFKAITQGGKPIVESGSNSNGSYVKYADGTMICYKDIWVNSDITNSWGNLYESTSAVSFGNWPQTFISTPIMNVVKMAGQGAWLELVENYSNTSCGRTYFVSAVSRSNASLNVHIIGIGKWN